MGDKMSLATATKKTALSLVSDPPQYSNPVQPHKQLQACYAGITGKQENANLRAASNIQTLCIVFCLIEVYAFELHKIGGKD